MAKWARRREHLVYSREDLLQGLRGIDAVGTTAANKRISDSELDARASSQVPAPL